MRVLLQRVRSGRVDVDGQTVGAIGQGVVLLTGIGACDTEADTARTASKIVHLRIFNDEDGKFNRSLLEIDGEALVVSQFTLFADVKKGRRPSFAQAARPETAEPLYTHFIRELERLGVRHVATGRFGAMMEVHIQNDGPVTIWVDSATL